jgi:zinc protease
MDDVKNFFFQHYVPNNAILVVAGNVKLDQVKQLAEKWFGPIPAGQLLKRNLPAEPKQTQKRSATVEAQVPADALYMTWHMPGRFHNDYYASDLLSDILSRGKSSRLYNQLVKEKEIFTSLSSFVMGTVDPGMFVVSGRVNNGISLTTAEAAVQEVLAQIVKEGIQEEELMKVKNQTLSTLAFGEVEVMNRAMNLAFAKLSGDANLVNQEMSKIDAITSQDIKRVAGNILTEQNLSTLYYQSTSTK